MNTTDIDPKFAERAAKALGKEAKKLEPINEAIDSRESLSTAFPEDHGIIPASTHPFTFFVGEAAHLWKGKAYKVCFQVTDSIGQMNRTVFIDLDKFQALTSRGLWEEIKSKLESNNVAINDTNILYRIDMINPQMFAGNVNRDGNLV